MFSCIYPHDPRKLIVTLHNAAPGYTSKKGGNFLILVDLQKGKVIQKQEYTNIAIPSGMVYDVKPDILYVADENRFQGYVHVHDGKTLKLLSSFHAGLATVHVDISSNGRHLVATNRLSADLSVFDLEKDPVIAQNGISINLGHPTPVTPLM